MKSTWNTVFLGIIAGCMILQTMLAYDQVRLLVAFFQYVLKMSGMAS